jgi:hypothetical protein
MQTATMRDKAEPPDTGASHIVVSSYTPIVHIDDALLIHPELELPFGPPFRHDPAPSARIR